MYLHPSSDADIVLSIIRREGGDTFTNRPEDKGGPTKFGITAATLSGALGKTATVEDVRNLTYLDAVKILTERYIVAPGFGKLRDMRLRDLLADCGVLHGPSRAGRWLQEALNARGLVQVKVDGVLGPVTVEMANDVRAVLDTDRLFLRICVSRIRFIGRIVEGDPSQAVFVEGWLARATEFLL